MKILSWLLLSSLTFLGGAGISTSPEPSFIGASIEIEMAASEVDSQERIDVVADTLFREIPESQLVTIQTNQKQSTILLILNSSPSSDLRNFLATKPLGITVDVLVRPGKSRSEILSLQDEIFKYLVESDWEIVSISHNVEGTKFEVVVGPKSHLEASDIQKKTAQLFNVEIDVSLSPLSDSDYLFATESTSVKASSRPH